MTKEYIIEGNRIIAEFMGGKFTLIKSHTPNVSFKKHPRYDRNFNSLSMHPKLLSYHKSWDWLLPAYHKLSTKLREKSDKIKSDKSCSWVSKQADLKHIDDCDCTIRCEIWGLRIDDTFRGVVETIKFINEGRWS